MGKAEKKYHYCLPCGGWVEGRRNNPYRCNQCDQIDISALASHAAHRFAKSQVGMTKLKKNGRAYDQYLEAAYWGALLVMENLLDTYKTELERTEQPIAPPQVDKGEA